MSEVVSEVIKREKKQKQRKQYPMTLYRRSYEVRVLCVIHSFVCAIGIPLKFNFKFISEQKKNHAKSQESLKRPISGSDFGYEIPLKDPHGLEAILSKEDLTGEGTTDIDGDASDVDK